jgi:PilZ domain
MTSEMAFECLLVSHDPDLYSTINRVLRNFSISVDHCLSSSKACDIAARGNHDLVVIDWEGHTSSELLDTIWHLRKKRKPTMLAISDQEKAVPGAHFTLRKPVTIESGTESLKAAYSRMLLDFRLNARYAVMTPVYATDESGRSIPLTITDIGDGGVGLSCKQKLEIGDLLSFSLQLARTAMPLHIQARVVWAREYGTAGCEFVSMPPVDKDILRDWLKAKIRVKKPLVSFSARY